MPSYLSFYKKFAALFLVFVLLLVQISCSLSGKPTAEPLSAEKSQPTQGQGGAERPAGSPQGGVDLAQPAAGLKAYTSFHQSFTLSMKGQLKGRPYESSQVIEREISGGGHTTRVQQNGTDAAEISLFNGLIDGYRYSQEQQGASCRAEASEGEEPLDSDPAQRLPAVFGMQEAGQETINGLAARHYTFDEKSLSGAEGQLKKAAGEIWLAQDGGAVLKYSLSVEIASADFIGTRAWVYELSQVNQVAALRLPETCQPVPADIPAMNGTTELVMMPGFQRYLAAGTRSDAVTFYHGRLSSLGWTPLPGSSPDTADLSSDVTVLSFTQPYLQGGRLAMVQLSEKDGRLQVVVQTALIRSAVKPYTSEPVETPQETGEDSPSGASGKTVLPSDLPAFPDAVVLEETEASVTLKVDAPVKDAVDFYTEELEGAGWTLGQNIEDTNGTLLMWTRDGESLMVDISLEGSMTQVKITSIPEG